MERRNFIRSTGLAAAGISLTEESAAIPAAKTPLIKRPVCAFTKCLQFLNFDQVAEVLVSQGFDGADVTVRPGGQIEPENAKTELPKAVKRLRKSGIDIPMIVTAVTDADSESEADILKIAADSGIRYYRMGWLAYDFKKTIGQNLDDFKFKFEKLARLNEKLGIHGGYQNHSGLHVGAPVWDLYDLVREVNPAFLGVQYDIRHAVTEGGYSWILGMKRVAPWIRTICIKDFVWGKDKAGTWKHQNVPLGEGMVSFDDFLKEYASLKVEAPVSIHFEYDMGGAESGKKSTTMEHAKIFGMMKADLEWFRRSLQKNEIDL